MAEDTDCRVKKAGVVINPASGRETPILHELHESFTEKGIHWEAQITHQKGDTARLTREMAGQDFDSIAVCGGDGTVGEAAGGLVGSDKPLARSSSGPVMNLTRTYAGGPKRSAWNRSRPGKFSVTAKCMNLPEWTSTWSTLRSESLRPSESSQSGKQPIQEQAIRKRAILEETRVSPGSSHT
jgi:hypothetical protein